jgi:hypothetical protein
MKLAPAPTPELQHLRDERIARFREHMRAWQRLDHFAVLLRHDGRRRMLEQIRAMALEAVYPASGYWHPAPPIVGRNLPGPDMSGHPFDRVTPDEVRAYVAADAFVREGLTPRMAADLAYLERTFGRNSRAR